MATTIYSRFQFAPGVMFPSGAQGGWNQSSSSGFGAGGISLALPGAAAASQQTQAGAFAGSGTAAVYGICTPPLLGNGTISGAISIGYAMNVAAGTWGGKVAAFVMKGDGSGIRGTLFDVTSLGSQTRSTHAAETTVFGSITPPASVNYLDGDFIQFEYGYTSTTLSGASDILYTDGTTAITSDNIGTASAKTFFKLTESVRFYPSYNTLYFKLSNTPGTNGGTLPTGSAGGWTQTNTATSGTNTKHLSPAAGTTQTTAAYASTGATGQICLGVFLSDPLAAQHIQANLFFQSMGWGLTQSASNSVQSYMYMDVLESDGVTVRGTVVSRIAINSAAAFTAERTQYFTGGISNSSVEVHAGDRLRVEIGVTAANSDTFTLDTDGITAITSNATATSTAQAIINFVSYLSFLPGPMMYFHNAGALFPPSGALGSWNGTNAAAIGANAKLLNQTKGTSLTNVTLSGASGTAGSVFLVSQFAFAPSLGTQHYPAGFWQFGMAQVNQQVANVPGALKIFIMKADKSIRATIFNGSGNGTLTGGNAVELLYVDAYGGTTNGWFGAFACTAFDSVAGDTLVVEVGIDHNASGSANDIIYIDGTQTLNADDTGTTAQTNGAAFIQPSTPLVLGSYSLALAGTVTEAGVMQKQPHKNGLAGTITEAGTLVRRAGKALSGLVTPTPNFQVFNPSSIIVSAGTLNDAPGAPQANHIFYAANTGLWWAFQYRSASATTMYVRYSSDLRTWNDPTNNTFTLARSNSARSKTFACWYKNISSVDVVHIGIYCDVSGTGSFATHLRATLSGTTVTWGTETAVSSTTPGAAGGPMSATVITSDNHVIDYSAVDAPSQEGNFAAVIATNTDSGSSWTAGFGTPTKFFETAAATQVATLVPLTNGNTLILADNGATVGTTGAILWSQWNGSAWSPNDATQHAVMTGNTTTGPFDWGVCRVSDTDVHVLRADQAGTGTFTHARFDGTSWSAGQSVPVKTSIGGAGGTRGGLPLVSDGTNVYAFLLEVTTSNVYYCTWFGATQTWDTVWRPFELSSHVRTFLSAYYSPETGLIAVSWTQTNSTNFDYVVKKMQIARRITLSLTGSLSAVGNVIKKIGKSLASALMVQNPVTDGLQAHWKFDEGSGTTVADSSGNGYTGTVVGTHLTWAPGILGSSISLPGDSQLSYVSTGFPEIDLDYSVSAWVYLLDSRTATIVGEDGAHGGASLITLLDDHTVLVRDVNNTGNTYTIPALAKNVWHHIVVSQTGSDQHCYADNVESSTGVLPALGAMLLDFIGYNNNSNSWYGGLDEIAYYDRGITPAEVAVLWNGGKGYSPGTPSVSFLYTIPYHLSLLANLVLGNTITTDTLYFRYDKPGRTSITYDRFGWDDYALAGDARALDPNPSTAGQQSASVVVANTNDTARVGQFSIPLAGSGFIPRGLWTLEFALKGTTNSFNSGVEIYVIDPAVGGSGFTFIMDRFISTSYTPDGEVTVLFEHNADQDVSYGPGSVLAIEILVTNCTGGDTVTGYAGGTSAITDDNISIASALSLIISPLPIIYQAEPSTLFRLTGHRLAATVTPAATLVRKVGRTLTASTTLAATLVKKTAHALAASLSQSGVLTRAKTIHASLTGSLSPLGSLLKKTSKPLTAGITSAASLVRYTTHNLASSSTPTGTLVRITLHVLVGSLSPAASLLKRCGKVINGTGSLSGALTSFRLIVKALSGTITASGVVVRLVNHIIAGTITASSTLARLIIHGLAATITSSAGLVKLTSHALSSAVMVPAGALMKLTKRLLTSASTAWSGLLSTSFISGGIENFQSLVGSLAIQGTLIRSTLRVMTVTFTAAGSLVKKALHGLTATTTASGSYSKMPMHGMSSTMTGTAGLIRNTVHNVAGSISISGSLARRVGKALTGSSSFAGVLSRVIGHGLTGALATTGSLTKRAARSFTGSVSPAGSLLKQAGKSLVAACASAGGLIKLVSRHLAGSLTLTGALSSLKAFIVSLSATLTSSATLNRVVGKLLTGGVQLSGTLIKLVSKILGGSASPAGTLVRSIKRNLSASVTSVGALARLVGHVLTSSTVWSGTQTKKTSHNISAALTPLGTLIKVVSKFFSGSTIWSGVLTNRNVKLVFLVGSLAMSAVLRKTIFKTLAAALLGSASMVKTISSHISAALTPRGALSISRLVSLALTASLRATGSLTRSTLHVMNGLVAMPGSISKRVSKVLTAPLRITTQFATNSTVQTFRYITSMLHDAGNAISRLFATGLRGSLTGRRQTSSSTSRRNNSSLTGERQTSHLE